MTAKLNTLTIEDLERELKARKGQEQLEREQEKKQYVTKRDRTVNRIGKQAAKLSHILTAFKSDVDTTFSEMEELCAEFGGIRKNSQGGFTLTNSENTFRVSRKLDSSPVWNELCDKGVSLIKEFLVSNLKTRDKILFEILMMFLEKNKSGDMNYPSIMKLLKHEDKFQDERWTEGCRLLRENFTTDFKKYYFVFSIKSEKGEWENINLNIASI